MQRVVGTCGSDDCAMAEAMRKKGSDDKAAFEWDGVRRRHRDHYCCALIEKADLVPCPLDVLDVRVVILPYP